MIRILSLDCETTDVTPEKGQIIEIGAIIAELDEANLEIKAVKEFESLISLRMEMHERITRITGIDENLLETKGISQNNAQEKWYKWLKDEKIDLIVGHSVDFDLNFLNKESWFLPDSKIVDTLELSKIILANYSAMNLEFLQKKLDLENFSKKYFSIGLDHNQTAHRALFDSKIALSLFKNIIDRLTQISFTEKFYENLNSFLPQLKLTFFAKNNATNLQETTSDPKEILISLNGEIKTENPNQKINNLSSFEIKKVLDKLEKLEIKTLPQELKQIFLQIQSGLILRFQNQKNIIKIHVFGNEQIEFLNLLTEELFSDELVNILDQKNKIGGLQIYKSENIENFISRSQEILSQKLNPSQIITLIEIYKNIEFDLSQNQKNDLEKLTSRFDFTMISLEPFWYRNAIEFDKQKNSPELISAKSKLQIFIKEVLEFNFATLPENAFFAHKIKLKIIQIQLDLKNSLQYFSSDNANLRKTYNTFSISVSRFNSPQEAVLNIIQKYPGIIWQTNLKKADLEVFLQLSELKEIFKKYQIQIQPVEEKQFLQLREINDFKELIIEREEVAKLNRKTNLIAFSRNTNYEKAKDFAMQQFGTETYLIPGESGSLTKVISKAKNKFYPIIILKSNEVEYFLKSYNQNQNLEIWIIEKPTFWIHKYWFERSKNFGDSKGFLETLKTLNLKSLAKKIFDETESLINLID